MLNNIYEFYYIFTFTIFIIMNLLFVINYLNNHSLKIIFCILFLLIISIIVGLRGNKIGVDTKNYIIFFEEKNNIMITDPLFIILVRITKYISNHYFIYLLVISFTTNFNYFISFYEIDKNNFCIYIAIFLSFFLFINININIIRQGLAMSFFFHGVVLTYNNNLNKKNKRFLVYFLFSILTHASAILVIIGYLLFLAIFHNMSPNKIKKLFYLLIISTFFITLSSLIKLFSSWHPIIEKAYWYLSWNQKKALSLKYFYLFIIIMLLFFSFKLKLKYNKIIQYPQYLHNIIRYYLLLLFSICFSLLFKEEEMFADRMFYYFFSFIPILIYSLRYYFVEKKIIKLFIYIGMNAWFIKSYLIQYVGWFITQDSIRK